VIEAIDTYYDYVARQMATAATSQAMCGYIAAQDWPLTAPVEGGLYLLYLTSVPVAGGESQILYQHQLQWVWLLIGTDIKINQVAENRGDRYRTNIMIMQNLRQANYPSFCPKKTFTVNSQTGVITGVGFGQQPGIGGADSVWWSKLRFMPKQDNDRSGLIYGAAALQLYAYDDVLPSVA
jgi:hypothetical protein